MPTEMDYKELPFELAIAYFQGKINMSTEKWNELQKEQHNDAFTVAGATKEELLEGFREAIDKAISTGTTLAEFQKDFDRLVAKHGWDYNGSRGWRTRIMLETNIRTAYAAGRHRQQTDPTLLKRRPYWEYRTGVAISHRPLHESWNGKVIRADDPWWKTHYPPNGWGCKCRAFALNERDLARLGKAGPDKAPEDGTYTWTDPDTGEEQEIPNGIDPGWNYTPGKSKEN